MTKNTVTDTDLATFTKRSHELYRRLVEGTLPAGIVIGGLQALIEGKAAVRTLAEMIKAGNYDWFNKDINEKRFTVDPARFTADGIEELDLGSILSKDVPAELERRDYVAATIEEGLAYGAKNPDAQRKHPLVIFGSSCRIDGDRHVACLYEGDRKRELNLYWDEPENRWSAFYRFLARRKSST